MTLAANRSILRSGTAARHFGAGFGAVAFVLAALVGTTTPAAAACAGPNLTIQRANAVDYVCRANCGAIPNALLAATHNFDGHDARPCMDLCDSRADCRSISFEFYYVGDTPMMRCFIWREGELTTYDRVDDARPRTRQPGVCQRRWAPSRDPRLQLDTERLQQDQYRPGLPGPGVPKKP